MEHKIITGRKPRLKRRKNIDEQTNQRIHEHLADENDVISEEDIQNAKTEVPEVVDTNTDNAEGEVKTNAEIEEEIKEKLKEDPDVKPGEKKDNADITPWNILDA
ncbi:MAG: hypothetical protein V4556_05465 [Bacteroidota bacterium]